MELGRYDAGDLLLLTLFEMAGFAAALRLLHLGATVDGGFLLSLVGWCLLLAHASVLFGQTWYPAMLRFGTTLAFPFSIGGLLAMPGLDVGWRITALVFFSLVILTYWISGRLFELGITTPPTLEPLTS